MRAKKDGTHCRSVVNCTEYVVRNKMLTCMSNRNAKATQHSFGRAKQFVFNMVKFRLRRGAIFFFLLKSNDVSQHTNIIP